MNGFIKIHRKVIDWGWYSDPITKAVFLHLLLTANFKDTEYRGVKIGTGQTVIGLKALADRLGLTTRNVRTALAHLEATGEITKISTNKFTVVTITNWAKYQLCDEQPTNNRQTTDKQLTNNRQTTDKQLTTPEEGKNEKNEKNDKNEKNVESPLTPLSGELRAAAERWLAYKQERGQKYKPAGLNGLVKKMQTEATKYGDHVVAELIDECIANMYQGIIWDRLGRRLPATKAEKLESGYDMLEEWAREQGGKEAGSGIF